MKIAKSILVKINNELKSKTEEQLLYLHKLYSSQLENLSEKDYDYFSESLNQKIALIEQELKNRKIDVESSMFPTI